MTESFVFYHRTNGESAQSILRDGFRDAAGRYMTDREFKGVWLSDYPLAEQEGAHGDTLLRVTLEIDSAALDEWEWIEEGRYFREWLIPAAVINRNSKTEQVNEADESLPSWP